jgi:hypothetical protein
VQDGIAVQVDARLGHVHRGVQQRGKVEQLRAARLVGAAERVLRKHRWCVVRQKDAARVNRCCD